MTHNPWSGLAPAVDAHLARWSIMKRVAEMTNIAVEGATEAQKQRAASRAVARVSATDAGMRWLAFARSYGLPDEQGIPRRSFELVDKRTGVAAPTDRVDTFDEAAAGGSLPLSEGQTISGREQFTDTSASLVTGVLMIQREFMMLDKAVSHYISAEVIDEVTWARRGGVPRAAVRDRPVHPCRVRRVGEARSTSSTCTPTPGCPTHGSTSRSGPSAGTATPGIMSPDRRHHRRPA